MQRIAHSWWGKAAALESTINNRDSWKSSVFSAKDERLRPSVKENAQLTNVPWLLKLLQCCNTYQPALYGRACCWRRLLSYSTRDVMLLSETGPQVMQMCRATFYLWLGGLSGLNKSVLKETRGLIRLFTQSFIHSGARPSVCSVFLGNRSGMICCFKAEQLVPELVSQWRADSTLMATLGLIRSQKKKKDVQISC